MNFLQRLKNLFVKKREGYWAQIEPYWEIVSIYDGPEVFLREFHKLPTISKNLFAAHWLQSEVHNGGFDQFFDNSTGVLAPEALLGFRALGMPVAAEVVEKAMSWFGDNYPRERDLRCDLLSDFWKKIENNPDKLTWARSLDPEFWDLMANEAGGFRNAADKYALNARKQ